MKLKFLNHIVNLFYPRVCAACGNLLMSKEETVCLSCRYLLPKTLYEKNADNPLAQMFYGQINFHAVTAEFFFSKTGKVQHLLHQLKYEGNKDAGFFLGQQLGESIKETELFQRIDYIIPIPLHPKKEHIRGYNQSHVIAQGVEDVTEIPIMKDCLYRKVFTSTQTKKSREERWNNVKDIFDIKNGERLKGQHILLIDDVLTTGATLMAAGKTLSQIPDIKISVATAACAS
ncbi:MAG: ComF family protein [Bacteroidales bacterium]|nr:ComF family protein [Bacteroidales bacterium]